MRGSAHAMRPAMTTKEAVTTYLQKPATTASHVIPTDEGGSVSMGGGSKEQKLKWEAIEGIDTLVFASV